MTLLNAERLYATMERNGLDAIVATSPENVTYSSGYWALSQWIRRGPQTYVIWPARGRGAPRIVASAGLLDLLADQEVNVEDVSKFGAFFVAVDGDAELSAADRRQADLYGLPDDGNANVSLAAALTEMGLGKARIGVDEGGLAPALDAFSPEWSEDATVLPAFQVFRQVRAVKTEEEIARLGKAAAIAEASIEAALRIAAPGVSEAEMGLEFNLETVRQGGLPVLYCIGTGPRSAMPNVQPGERKLKDGDIIRFDVGGRYKHYRADIARIAVLGTPTQKIRTYHNALYKGVERGLELLRPGARAAEIFDAVVETVRQEGIPHYQRSHVGHGIGLDGYDLPSLSPGSADIIEEGMVLCVETPYYELGFGGLQVENMVVVRADGIQSLMGTDGKLRILS
ncbi:aminopeptidase P family protein [Pelagibius litoralis]|uniref:Aminopeptidase P family protein n=1 Tax=Pelagibius litoralis TaxID=374515 RepID=A0A967C2A9_9PROT|nr:Xaa-Pro peptidase family protein [Pelagibius litoralis]NIA68198.1 aminopeptidase P family protein [Pelagibius litoralis]